VDRIDHINGEVLPGTSATRIVMEQEELLQRYPKITAELEHLLGNALVEGLRNAPAWCNAEAMGLLPARDQQKGLLDQLEVDTSPWQSINTPAELDAARLRLGDDLVVKSVRDGYDGKGQWIVTGDEDGGIPVEAYGAIIAERRIGFSRELSLVGARFSDGSSAFFPLVENYHQSGMLRYTLAPAVDTGSLQPLAESMLGRIMDSLDYVGVMAMECFHAGDGLLVNELAPRVHNSGHWSQAGADLSQFDLHLLAVLDRPVSSLPPPRGVTLMLNLIGCEWNPAWQSLAGIQCWWYGKSWRENRKLGHINLNAPDWRELVGGCERLMPTLDPFHREMLELAVERIGQS
jgi:5-(carboxyamino)imidazole ribonucleotide synthase